MPDISMCCTVTCPKRAECYRYRAVPTPDKQSLMVGTPWSEEEPCL